MTATRLRFLFSAADMNRIDPTSVIVEDIPMIENGVTLGINMRIRFRVTDPVAGAPRIQPLFPGALKFLADPAQPGVIPNPATDVIDDSAYDDWKTTGRLMVTRTTSLAAPFTTEALLVEPTRFWCSPVRITRAFLFRALIHDLPVKLKEEPGLNLRDSAMKERYAIARFLAGAYSPMIRQHRGADAMLDDVAVVVMPEVTMSATGEVVLDIAMAHAPRTAFDGKLEKLNALTPDLPITSQMHPANGSLPARLVYGELRGKFVEAATPVMDAMLPIWPQAPRLLPLRFTRICEPLAECSIHLPRQNVRITDLSGTTVLLQRVPLHGIVYVPQPAPTLGAAAPPPPILQIEIEGGMRWLDGALPKLWEIKGGLVPVTFDLSAQAIPHVVMRLPMSEAMMSDETRPKKIAIAGHTGACTFFSLRRTIRAWVDNRIAGGRLNFNIWRTNGSTKELIRRAIPSAAMLANNMPPVNTDPKTCYIVFRSTLNGLFPGDAPLFVNRHPGAPSPSKSPLNMVMYQLWQTQINVLHQDDTRDYFSDEHVGHGAPGAMVQMGLAAYHHRPLLRNIGESDADFEMRLRLEDTSGRVALALQTGLMPGALVQYWYTEREYVLRSSRSLDIDFFGHSPIFERYEESSEYSVDPDIHLVPGLTGPVQNLLLIDQSSIHTAKPSQHGDNTLTIVGSPVWITANWTE